MHHAGYGLKEGGWDRGRRGRRMGAGEFWLCARTGGRWWRWNGGQIAQERSGKIFPVHLQQDGLALRSPAEINAIHCDVMLHHTFPAPSVYAAESTVVAISVWHSMLPLKVLMAAFTVIDGAVIVTPLAAVICTWPLGALRVPPLESMRTEVCWEFLNSMEPS